ncbi:DUF6883 domain-containing protein [Synechocystis sp. CACIAM 05]|uniref:DUF6883 domain-containing protein n=1 Tax=Synechocystis sp. CACIAM 05 TaxID=1933929 RepID=UPI00138E6367|nr:hypothetical protein BWK47_07000 [Synechocystis sp. CACIAM 05]
MKLPYGNQADVKQITDKLQTYSLNLNHPNGKHKARLFRAKLGISLFPESRKEYFSVLYKKSHCEGVSRFSRLDNHGGQYLIKYTT